MREPYREPPPQEGDDDIVTVATRSSALEAEMAREYLKDHGIVAFSHEAASFNPILNEIAGGARVLVRAADEVRARSLLARAAKAIPEDDEVDDEVRCPRCELTYCFHETAFQQLRREGTRAGGLALLFALLAVSRPRWRCGKCLHVWDDEHEGPRRRTALHPDDPRPVFRWRRRHPGTGLFFGLVVGFLAGAALAGANVSPYFSLPVLLLPPIVGWFLGRRSVRDICSEPSCRAALPQGAHECPACGGAIAGVIERPHEHYSRPPRSAASSPPSGPRRRRKLPGRSASPLRRSRQRRSASLRRRGR
ncbi:MAG: DUF2007 domain-containing protein [Polyangiaceae bacterium]